MEYLTYISDLYYYFYPHVLSKFDTDTIRHDDVICIIGDVSLNSILIKDIVYTINLKNNQNFFDDGCILTNSNYFSSFIPKSCILDTSNGFDLSVERNRFHELTYDIFDFKATKPKFFIREITKEELTLTTLKNEVIYKNTTVKNIDWKRYDDLFQIYSIPFKNNSTPRFVGNNLPTFIFLNYNEKSIDYVTKNFPDCLATKYIKNVGNEINFNSYLVIDTVINKIYIYNTKDHEDFKICKTEKWLI